MLPEFPTPRVLHWLGRGQLKSSFSRAVRSWAILKQLYGVQGNSLPNPWRYPDLRDRLFAPDHPQGDESHADLILGCKNQDCICHKPSHTWLNPTPEWCEETCLLAGLSVIELEQNLDQFPFATVHRSLRADLKLLAQQGWLQELPLGQYRCLTSDKLPQLPDRQLGGGTHTEGNRSDIINSLSTHQTIELYRALEKLVEIHPGLEFVMEPLSLQILKLPDYSQRVFIHLDYILPLNVQDRINNYQSDIEDLWQKGEGGVLQFHYWFEAQRKVKVTVYPVCLHYMRRAKYLSAYGKDPEGRVGWHNYRLDRIDSDRLKVLAWGDRSIPLELKEMRRTGKLPTPEDVKTELDRAWGFKFYSAPQLMILRFLPDFARWYVNNTERHSTFKPIAYKQLPTLIRREISDRAEREELLDIVKQRSPDDISFEARIRPDDINLIQRLRDWRPNGEVIAPLSLRQQMADEAKKELLNYES